MNRWTLTSFVALVATAAAQAAPPLTALVSTDRTQYGAGRAVEISLALRNDADFVQTIQYREAFEYDVIVRDRESRIVYQWSANKRPSRELSRFQIEPWSSRKTREIWDRRGLDGRKVPDGVYTIEARLFPLKPVFTQVYLGSGPDTIPARDRDTIPAREREDRDRGDSRDRGQGRERGNDGPIGSPIERGFFAKLATDRRTVRVGDTVEVTYTVSNQSDYAVSYDFNSSQLFEIEAIFGGRCVWRLSDSQRPDRRFTQLFLQPYTRRQFTASFPIVRGTQPGDYTLRAYLKTSNYDRGSAGEATTKLRIDR